MIASAAMRMLVNPRSGYYGSVADINGDGLDHRFGEAFGRAGGTEVIPYDVPINDGVAHIRAMRHFDPKLSTPLFVRPDTLTGEVRKLLLGQLPDAAAYIVDENRRLKATVGLKDLRKNGEKTSNGIATPPHAVLDSDQVWIHARKENLVTAQKGIKGEELLRLMRERNVHEVPITDVEGRVEHAMTETATALSLVLEPNMHESGFGTMFTVGVGPRNDMLERIDALMEAGAAGFFIETAHAYRRDVIGKYKDGVLEDGTDEPWSMEQLRDPEFQKTIREIRRRYPHAVIGFGTVTEPEAVELLHYLGVDIVKVGVGGGGHCSTFDVTGVGGYPFRSWWLCGRRANALGKIQTMNDGGVNSTRRFNIAASMDGTALVQIGTWFGATVESASQHELVDDAWRKRLFGEASDYAEKRRREEQGIDTNDIRREIDRILGIHSEGKVSFAPVPLFMYSYVGGIIYAIKRAQQSWGTYVGGKNMQQGQERSRIMKLSMPFKPV